MHIHDTVVGQAILRKEEIQQEIEHQMELGKAGLQEEDHWMMEVNLGDMVFMKGGKEDYWLLAINAAWIASTLTRQGDNCVQAGTTADGH